MKPLKKRLQFQQGIVLITGMIFLLVLTMIGIFSMSNTAINERMTQNYRDTTIGFNAAEAALGDGEIWVQNQTIATTPVSTCSSAPCNVWAYNVNGTFWKQGDSWWQANARPFSSTLSNVALQPDYVIELFSFVPYQLSPDAESKGQGYYYYRITARGTGATDNSHSVVQSIYATQFN